jgi:hypothetical protein
MMDRVLEPELMEDPEQAAAYAAADFSQENQGFVDRFEEYFPGFSGGRVLDVGCGPAIFDSIRYALPLLSSNGGGCLSGHDPAG